MSFYFRDKPRFSERLRGKLGDDLLEEIKQHFDDDGQSFFSSNGRTSKPDSFDRRASFSRGFPFDDEEEGRSFGRRSDIRAHLDDLAARHPEFAEHLLGPPWADAPIHNTTRSQRRRGSGSAGSNQAQSDEDARSQASGSSAASAASGASAVSSHGEPDGGSCKRQQETRRNPIPQYGLRNTVDIGQQRHDMENNDKNERNQRSMSAPPENRQQPLQQNEEQQQQPQGQRFVSRVDITPQHNQKQQTQPQQPPQQQASNVRHIPIFVEGRDEPVIPKNVEEAHFQRQPSPPHFTRQSSPPHFTRQSPFGQSWGSRQQWPPHFQDTFYQPQSTFEQPSTRRFHEQQRGYAPQQTFQPRNQQQKQRPEPQQRQGEQHQQKQPEQHQHSEQQQQQQEPPKPKPQIVPKDALEKVALVQQEVDSLAQQVKEYTGNSRKDKQYIYLDEMLTRELIKLDDIETEGRENVRQARKNAIRAIQETISLLESKAPLPDQVKEAQQPQEEQQMEVAMAEEKQVDAEQSEKQEEPMDTSEKEEKTVNEAIPLPPAAVSSAPTQTSTENTEQNQNNEAAKTEALEESKQQEPQDTACPMSTEIQEKPDTSAADVQQQNTTEQSQEKIMENTVQDKNAETQNESTDSAMQEQTQIQQEGKAEDMVVEKQQPMPSPKSPKKTKKTKKQTPVSQEAIPLPAPEIADTK